MHYATEGSITTADKSNDTAWIEITEQQYADAVTGTEEGRVITIVGGFAVIDPPEPEEPETPEPEPPTFEDMQAAKLQDINADFSMAASALTDGYPEAERLTWPVQQQEALVWAEDSAIPTPYLDGLAAARGIEPEEMRQKTLDQTQLFMQASQALVGKRQRLRDLVYEAQTPDDLDAIQWDDPPAA